MPHVLHISHLMEQSISLDIRFEVGKVGRPNPSNFTSKHALLNWKLHHLSVCTQKDSVPLKIFTTFSKSVGLGVRSLV